MEKHDFYYAVATLEAHNNDTDLWLADYLAAKKYYKKNKKIMRMTNNKPTMRLLAHHSELKVIATDSYLVQSGHTRQWSGHGIAIRVMFQHG